MLVATLHTSSGTRFDTLTGEGLSEVLKNAAAIVDVSNSPSFDEKALMEFFQASTRNLIAYGASAGVKHYVAWQTRTVLAWEL